MIAAGFHSHGKIICTLKSRDEQRDQKRYHIGHALYEIAGLKIRPSRDLSLHDFIRFLHQNRNKAQRDRHHHGYLVNRNLDNFEWAEQVLHCVSELIRRRRQRHDRRSDDKIGQSNCHSDGLNNAFLRDGQPPEREDNFARREQHVKKDCDDQNKNDGFHSLQHHAKRNFRELHKGHESNRDEHIACQTFDQKQRNNEDQRTEKFDPGIQLMEDRICRIILSDRDISHLQAPFPARASRMLFFASSTVVACTSTASPLAARSCMIYVI